MKNIMITGSNGMIGALILESCLQRDDVGKVTTISRKPSGLKHPKLNEVIHQNFVDYTSIKSHFQNQDICFFCIGVYTGAVPKDEFVKITVDYTKIFAETLRAENEHTTFCFLSGEGADSSEKSSVLFARSKGIAENILMRLNFTHLYIFRPGYIYPVTPRKEPNVAYRLMRFLYKPVISKLAPNASVTSTELAQAMIHVSFSEGDKVIYENRDIRHERR